MEGNVELRSAPCNRSLHLLRPFLADRDCPTCGTWSTCHADRATKGAAVFKSLGHRLTLEDTSPAVRCLLKQIGLVRSAARRAVS